MTIPPVTPYNAVAELSVDIHHQTPLHFGQEVQYDLDEIGASLDPEWGVGYFLEPCEQVGNTVPYKILTKDTNQVIYRRYVYPVEDPNHEQA